MPDQELINSWKSTADAPDHLMTITDILELSVYDNIVTDQTQQAVYDFLQDSTWCVNFYDPPHSKYHPRSKTYQTSRDYPASHRLPIAWDENSLLGRAPVINQLWTELNGYFNNRYQINGATEGMSYMTGISPLDNGYGWRVYGDSMDHQWRQRPKSIHRDSNAITKKNQRTIVYFANRSWYPNLYGETVFHRDDVDRVTGDYTRRFEKDQSKKYAISHAGSVVSPSPGRVMIFDSRYLHQIKPTADYADELLLAVVFRVTDTQVES